MTEYKIGAQLFRDMVVAAANYLEHNKKMLNDLNVFPVPDGDTGTNMLLTLVSAAREVNACPLTGVGKVAAALGDGALKGAGGIPASSFPRFSAAFPRAFPRIRNISLRRILRRPWKRAWRRPIRP